MRQRSLTMTHSRRQFLKISPADLRVISPESNDAIAANAAPADAMNHLLNFLWVQARGSAPRQAQEIRDEG